MNSFPLGRFQGAIVGAAVGYRRGLPSEPLPENPPWENDWLQFCDRPSTYKDSSAEESEDVARIFLAALPCMLCEEGLGHAEKDASHFSCGKASPVSGRGVSIAMPCERMLVRALWGMLSSPPSLDEILTSRACQEMETKHLDSWQTIVALLDRNASLEEAKEHFGRCSIRWGAYCFLSAAEHFSVVASRAARFGGEAAAIAGALAGAYVGIEGIPTAWLFDAPDRFSSFQLLGARLLARWAGASSLPADANWLGFPAVAPYPLPTNIAPRSL